MMNHTDTRRPLPASAWGADTARIARREDEYLASRDPRDADADYRDALARALGAQS
jgi:hypothetical protein